MLIKVKVHNVSNIQNKLDKIKEIVNLLEKEVGILQLECKKIGVELTDENEEIYEKLAESIS